MITAAEIHIGQWVLTYENGVFVGELLTDVDGFLYFWRNEDLHGFEAAHQLRQIADIMDDLNAPWQANIDAYFAQDPAAP